MNTQLFITLISGLGTSLLGLITLSKNSRSATNRLLFLFTIILTAYNIVNYFAATQTTNEATFFFVKTIMALAVLINLSFFLLASTFPGVSFKLPTPKLLICNGFTILLIMASYSNLIFTSVTLTPTGTNSTTGLAMPLFLLHTILFLGAGFTILVKKYRHSIGREKQQFKFLFGGSLLMFTAILVTNLLFVIIFNTSKFIQLLPIYTFFFIGLLSYAIIKYRFLDISLLVARAVSFSILTALIAFLYTTGLFAMSQVFKSSQPLFVSTFIAIILLYTYNPLRRAIEKTTNNIFHKEQYHSDTLLENLGETIRATLSLEKLAKDTLDELAQAIHVSRAVYLISQEKSHPIIIAHGFDQKPEYSEKLMESFKATAKNKLILFDDLDESPTKTLLRQEQISILIPLKVKSTHHGFLILGEKDSGEIYSEQDINVLEILMPQLSVAIQNAKSYEEISHFNITLKEEVNNATDSLKKANRHLKHLDKLKDEFVFIATHELKNPVTAMRGYLSMLQEGSFGPIPDPMKDPVDQLQASNQQLVELVNDLLQIARAEAKTITINTVPVKLCEVVEVVMESVMPLVKQKGLTLEHECLNKNLQVMADENRLKEILNNLISNAIKYSDHGRISISYEIIDNLVITHISDNGVGIPEKDQDHIFTRFFRVEEEMAKGIPGTGLGLFIVKQLIEKMGGTISFKSVYGQGTTFSFSLPRSAGV